MIGCHSSDGILRNARLVNFEVRRDKDMIDARKWKEGGEGVERPMVLDEKLCVMNSGSEHAIGVAARKGVEIATKD